MVISRAKAVKPCVTRVTVVWIGNLILQNIAWLPTEKELLW